MNDIDYIDWKDMLDQIVSLNTSYDCILLKEDEDIDKHIARIEINARRANNNKR